MSTQNSQGFGSGGKKKSMIRCSEFLKKHSVSTSSRFEEPFPFLYLLSALPTWLETELS